MKSIILICIISLFTCDTHFIDKYGSTSNIYRYYDSYGRIVLDVSDFNQGDSIYITYSSFDGKYTDTIQYAFGNSYYISLNRPKTAYSEAMTTNEHNISDGGDNYHLEYTYDYDYYYEFTKPDNETQYLVMGYDLNGYYMDYIVVDNTRFSRGVTTIIIVCTIIGVLLIAGATVLILKCREKCNCSCSLSDCFSCCDCCDRAYSDNINTSYSNANNITTNVKTELQYREPEPVPEIHTPDVPVTSYQPDEKEEKCEKEEKEEKPYYLDQNQNQNYIPPPAGYYPPPQDQGYYPPPDYNTNTQMPPSIYDANNQIPPTDNVGYNNGYYAGGNNAYQ